MHRIVILVAPILILCGCDESTTSSDASHRVRVTESEYGDKWPLTVDSGEIECIDDYFIVFHVTNGKTYALNGAATSRGFPEIDPIWRDNPNLPGIKINIGPLIGRGLALCK